MKLPARHGRHLRKVVSKLQGGEDRLDLPDGVGRHAAEVIIFIKPSKPFVPELPDDHGIVYGATVRLSSRRAVGSQFLDIFPFSRPHLFLMPVSTELC